jgi:hypothetical protein
MIACSTLFVIFDFSSPAPYLKSNRLITLQFTIEAYGRKMKNFLFNYCTIALLLDLKELSHKIGSAHTLCTKTCVAELLRFFSSIFIFYSNNWQRAFKKLVALHCTDRVRANST